MSRRSEPVAAETCVALGATDARVASYPNRELNLGSLAISRARFDRESVVRFDWYGFSAFTIGMVAIHVVIGQGAVLGWRSPTVVTLAVAFVVAAVLFFRIESGNPNGFVDLTLFRNKTYTGATLSNFLGWDRVNRC